MSAMKAILASSPARRGLLDIEQFEAKSSFLERVAKACYHTLKIPRDLETVPLHIGIGWDNAVKRGPRGVSKGCEMRPRDKTSFVG